MTSRALLLTAAIALGGCSGSDKKTEETKTPAKEPAKKVAAPVDVFKAMIAAAKAGDEKAFLAHVAAKADPRFASLTKDAEGLKMFMGGIAKSKDATGKPPADGATKATVSFKYWEGGQKWDDVTMSFVLEDGAWKAHGEVGK